MALASVLERYEKWQERWRDPTLTALLVLLSLEIFVNIPVSQSPALGGPVFVILWFLVLISAVLVAARHWIAIGATLISASLTLIANTARLQHPCMTTICLSAGCLVVFMAAVACVVWMAVFGPGRVTHHRIQGAVVLYLSIALSFAALYEILLTVIPGSISGIPTPESYPIVTESLIYYSVATLTSTGYGDLLPMHPLARSLSNLEAVIGQLFPATLLARIVMLELQARRSGG